MNFEEASEQAQNMFAQDAEEQQAENPYIAEAPPEEAPQQEVQPAESVPAAEGNGNQDSMQPDMNNAAPLDMGTQQMLQQQQIQQILAENQQLRSANEELQKTITQQSDEQEGKIEEMALPQLDLSDVAFDDEETLAQKQKVYAQKMADYVRQGIMSELAPYLDEAKRGIEQKEQEDTINFLEQMPQFKEIRGALPQINRIMEQNNNLFAPDAPYEDRIIAAYAIARGANAINTPPKAAPTTDELMAMYNANPEFQQMIEKQRIDALKDSQQVPVMSASSGLTNAALNIKGKPQTMDEASERARAMFRL